MAKGFVRSAPSLRSIPFFLVGRRSGAKQSERSGAQAARDGFANKEGVGEMQTRSTHLDHHHQDILRKSARSSPEAELIALARGKGQLLTEHTLMLIRDALELRGVSLEVFVADVRPHFRNNIVNPSGFLINRARRFHELARPAQVRVAAATSRQAATGFCASCKGQKFVIGEKTIEPCPVCSTPDFRHAWECKEAERRKRAALGQE